MASKYLKFFIIFSIICTTSLHAQLAPSLRETTKYSVRQLEDWLKRQNRPNYLVPATLSISGDVSSSWENIYEVLGKQPQVGSGTSNPNNVFGISTKLQLSYKAGKTWGVGRLTFKNTGGVFNGSANSINLGRAFIGYHFFTGGPMKLDITAGRRELNTMYNSQIAYSGKGDGATGYFSYQWGSIADLQATGGLYTSLNASFFIVRGSIFNIANLGAYIDYSFSYWGSAKPVAAISTFNTKYGVSQFLMGWDFSPRSLFKHDIQLFVALLTNHRAVCIPLSNGAPERGAGYVGAQVGRTKKRNDWSLQGQLQFCQLQAVPEWDVSGIGQGASARGAFNKATSLNLINGKTNYKGWQLKLQYALTDTITLTSSLKRALPDNKAIGRDSNFTSFKLEAVFSF